MNLLIILPFITSKSVICGHQKFLRINEKLFLTLKILQVDVTFCESYLVNDCSILIDLLLERNKIIVKMFYLLLVNFKINTSK